MTAQDSTDEVESCWAFCPDVDFPPLTCELPAGHDGSHRLTLAWDA